MSKRAWWQGWDPTCIAIWSCILVFLALFWWKVGAGIYHLVSGATQ